MTDEISDSLEKPSDLGKSPQAVARRWKLELKLADKREADWRKKSADIYKAYTPSNPVANSFNILWTNTETLRQSVYNSLPQPAVRRRYSDEDPLGKAVGEVLTRALEFAQDTYDFDGVLKGDVLSMLLPGRAVSRVRYVPDIRSGAPETQGEEADESESYEEIEWEQVICERVQYDDFRILCAAKTWDEVSAIAFRHRFTREDCIEKFGDEVGAAIPLDSVEDEDVKKSKDVEDLFKTAEVWEIWDKDEKQVLWICKTHPEPCKVQGDPLSLSGFFPIPRPLYAIENDQTLIPAALYTQYEQQAKELNRISIRINRLIDALKVRGIYDSMLGELAQLMKAADNELIPAANVTALLERGGLDKAIWMMPIETAAQVIKELYVQRDATKQVIYEITGIADIMRSASDPNETFGAQKIKTQWGTQRLQRLQKEVQRYIRDLIRLKAEIIAEKFQPETLEAMTLVDLPHQAQVDQANMQAMAQYQHQVQMMQMQPQPPQQPGQPPAPPQQPPPPPQPQNPITWEKVIEAMHSDATRTYRVDIETDSTLSATQDSDMQGLKEVLMGCSQIMQSFGPAVQQGAMDVSVLKELMLAVVRRAKMGSAVEDAFDKIKQPPPPPNPEAGKLQAQLQIEQGKAQVTMQVEQMKAQLGDQQNQRELAANAQADEQRAQREMQVEQWKQQMQAAQIQHQNELEAQRNALQQQINSAADERKQALESQAAQMELEYKRWSDELKAATTITVAQITAKSSMDQTLVSAEQGADTEVAAEMPKPDTSVIDAIKAVSDKVDAIHAHTQAPRKIVRGPDGKATGVDVGGVVKPINRGPDGRVEGY